MARLARVAPIGVPVHIIQRGNNRQDCFLEKADFAAYLHWLEAYSKKYNVEVHAWVLMTNHVHLLCTPQADNAVSLMMQALGRQYVRYFNQQNERSGTLWEGRFRSCLIESETYLFTVYRYIELNPVRAQMVARPEDYEWSSYKMNALGWQFKLGAPHSLYTQLGRTPAERQKSYQDLFAKVLDEVKVTEIREATRRGLAVGSETFKQEIADLTGRRVAFAKRGRPLLKKREKEKS